MKNITQLNESKLKKNVIKILVIHHILLAVTDETLTSRSLTKISYNTNVTL